LTVNGVNHGIFDDTSFRVPSGKFIHFESNHKQNTASVTVSNISVSQWRGSNLSSGKELAELDPDRDTLLDIEGLKYTGEIENISRETGLLTFAMKHANKPMLVPLSQIQSLYFSAAKDKTTKNETGKYILSLQGCGSLSVESILLSKKQISAKHPILGEITLKPSSLDKITSTSNSDE
jgi:hypothetical protein